MLRTTAALTPLLAGVLTVTAAPAANAAPYCGITWGSTPEASARMEDDPLFDVRAGRHTCFDRLVVHVAGDRAGYDVRYVSTVTQDGSGDPVPVRGGARLQVVVRAPAHDAHGAATCDVCRGSQVVDVSGYSTFRQVAWAGSFEGSSTLGLGVRARLPFRVFALDGPDGGSRVVVDVAHRW